MREKAALELEGSPPSRQNIHVILFTLTRQGFYEKRWSKTQFASGIDSNPNID